jgi:hypothetical protein
VDGHKGGDYASKGGWTPGFALLRTAPGIALDPAAL